MREPSLISPHYVRTLMTVGGDTCSPGTPIADVSRLILQKGLKGVIVLDEGHAGGIEYPAAVISFVHILQHLDACDPKELRDLGIQC